MNLHATSESPSGRRAALPGRRGVYNDPTWLSKGQADQPLHCTADGLEWFDGPTDSITVVTDIQVSGVDVQKKTRQIDITKGLVCNIWPESDWVTVHTGTNCPTS